MTQTTDTTIFAALRTFLVRDVLLDGVEVLQTQQNRVPQPVGANYVMMTMLSASFLSSSYRHYHRELDRADIERDTAKVVQLDFYGPDSSDNAQRFATLFRDDFGFLKFANTDVTPLYCDEGTQMPLTNGERQYEARWMLRATLQVTPTVSTPMQFADRVAVTIVEAD